MAKTIRENQFYFALLAVFVLAGGIYLATNGKADAILFFSENRSPELNLIFKVLTKLGEAPAFVVVALVALAFRIRYTILVALTGLLVMGISFSLKAYFAIDRPFTFFAKQNQLEHLNLVDGVNLHVGATSFPSGHTMAAFALYSLLIFLLPSQKRYVTFFFSLALLVGISRIYLVQHFWPDVYVGAMVGVLLAMVVYSLQTLLSPAQKKWMDRPMFQFRQRNTV